MPGGRALFSVVPLPRAAIPDGKFLLATRRGKQFNSILYGTSDPITGARVRTDVLLAEGDLAALGLADGDRVVLRSELGEMAATARVGPVRARHVQAFWPEANVLIGRRYDPVSGEPDYNAVVSVERA
jgi:anaerobic selenocysteine-containing dehydrogenase